MRHPLAGISLLIWILWAQTYPLIEVNDSLMISTTQGDGIWRYRDGFDTKAQCHERRKTLISEQQSRLAALTPESPELASFIYREFRCYPETINPHELTRLREW